MNEEYLRQRRNLLSITILILLSILGGSNSNPLYPIQLERPYIAELFIWIGFGYFWYRTRIYTPINIFQHFKNEIILSHVIKYDPISYSHHNLLTFIGSINTHKSVFDSTTFEFFGVTEATGNGNIGRITIPLNLKSIFSTNNYLKNIFKGKVVTDYCLPHMLAITTLFIGTELNR